MGLSFMGNYEKSWLCYHINVIYDFESRTWKSPTEVVPSSQWQLEYPYLPYNLILAGRDPRTAQAEYQKLELVLIRYVVPRFKVNDYENKFYGMPVDISHKNVARIWCRNETDSQIMDEKRVRYLDAYQACFNLNMHLWYPIKPFQNVSIDESLLSANNIFRDEIFWTSLERINSTHWKSPINIIILNEWIDFAVFTEERKVSQVLDKIKHLYFFTDFESVKVFHNQSFQAYR